MHALLPIQPEGTRLAEAIGDDWKGKFSPVIYAVSIPIALVAPAVAFAMYVVVAVIWVVPDTRIERTLNR